MNDKSVIKRLTELRKEISTSTFLEKSGLGNEMPFYIFDYNPKEEIEVRTFLQDELLPKFVDDSKVKIVNIDIFELMIESLKKDKIFERTFSLEERKGTEFLFDALRKSFNSDIICSMIDEKSKDSNIVFLTGFGKIFPIVRGHMVLNNLQKTLGFSRKLILFFPGKYTDLGLSTFGKFEDNNYYRAFRICG